MLAAFNIEKAVDEDGKPIAPDEEYHPSFVRCVELRAIWSIHNIDAYLQNTGRIEV